MSTASIASAALATIMIIVIVISYMVRINPDNIATPIAASLGDLVTLGLLSVIARWLYDLSGECFDSAPARDKLNYFLTQSFDWCRSLYIAL